MWTKTGAGAGAGAGARAGAGKLELGAAGNNESTPAGRQIGPA